MGTDDTLTRDFAEGLFYAICQRQPTNREMANIVRYAKTKKEAVRFIKKLPESAKFLNNFYGLSFNWVDFNLAFGECPSPFQADLLTVAGINSFVDLTGQPHAYKEALSSGIEITTFCLENDSYNGADKMRAPAEAILRAIGQNKRVYLHCLSGISRSAALAGIITGVLGTTTYRLAMEKIKALRPMARPHPDLILEDEADALIRSLIDERTARQG